MPEFRFAMGQHVRVLTHLYKPIAVVEQSWPGEAWNDPYGENIYQVSGFLVKQRERALEEANGRLVRRVSGRVNLI